MLKFLFLTLPLVLATPACSMDPAAEPVIINLGQEFSEFAKQAENRPFEEQTALWDDLLESRSPKFYAQVVHSKNSTSDWEKSKLKSAQRLFPALPELTSDIELLFHSFENEFSKQVDSFRKLFPDFSVAGLQVFAVPSLLKFNGKVSSIDGEPVLAFGLDQIAYFSKNPTAMPGLNSSHDSGVLYSHELFHVHHIKAQGFDQERMNREGTLANVLWNEGLATYVSSVANPEANLGELFMDNNLAELCPPIKDELMSEFARIVDLRLDDKRIDSAYIKWFTIGREESEIPVRAGYCLGYYVAKSLAKTHGLRNVVQWDFAVARDQVTKYVLEYRQSD